MDKMVLRGYVTAEDFTGTDAERIQKALDYACRADIRKVILSGSYTVDRTLIIPAQTHLVLDNAVIIADGISPLLQTLKQTNYSFEQKWVYIEGERGRLEGDLWFFNTSHIVLEQLEVWGTVTLEYCHDVRMEHVSFRGNGGIRVGRGCGRFILQYLKAETEITPVVIANDIFCGDIVPAREPEIRNIVLRDSELITDASAVVLRATQECGMFNIQADHIKARAVAVEVGQEGKELPPERYFNLTFTDLDTPAENKLLLHNAVKHAYTSSC